MARGGSVEESGRHEQERERGGGEDGDSNREERTRESRETEVDRGISKAAGKQRVDELGLVVELQHTTV